MALDSKRIKIEDFTNLINLINRLRKDLVCDVAIYSVNKNNELEVFDTDVFFRLKRSVSLLVNKYKALQVENDSNGDPQKFAGILSDLKNNEIQAIIGYFEYSLVFFIRPSTENSEFLKILKKRWAWKSPLNIARWKTISKIGIFCDVNHNYATIVSTKDFDGRLPVIGSIS